MTQILENVFLDKSTDNFFINPAFYNKCSDSSGVYFELESLHKVIAKIHFAKLEKNHWRSPGFGTFSGYSFQSSLSLRDLLTFHQHVCESLVSKGAGSIEILLHPEAHDSVAFSKQFYILQSTGFKVTQCDLNYSIVVDAESFGQKITYGNRKRLKKCSENKLEACILDNSNLAKVYQVIEKNRLSKDYPMTMTLLQIEEMMSLFPNHYVLFGVEYKNEIIAGSICIKTSPNMLYVFYWGDLPGYGSFSPIVLLAEKIYEYCQKENIYLLDIGTSTIGNQMNDGLITFKKGLGFFESIKVRMTKYING